MSEDPKIITIGIGICMALVSAVGVLWKDHRASKIQSDKRHQKCENQHSETRHDLLCVTREVGELKGRVHVAEELKPKLDEIGQLLKKK